MINHGENLKCYSSKYVSTAQKIHLPVSYSWYTFRQHSLNCYIWLMIKHLRYVNISRIWLTLTYKIDKRIKAEITKLISNINFPCWLFLEIRYWKYIPDLRIEILPFWCSYLHAMLLISSQVYTPRRIGTKFAPMHPSLARRQYFLHWLMLVTELAPTISDAGIKLIIWSWYVSNKRSAAINCR